METGISRTFRHLGPAHYILKVEKFSMMSEMEKYESGAFEAGGYKWKLMFYPNGDKEKGGENHISLYLTIFSTESLPISWEVYAIFKLFVHNQIKDKYLIIQDNANGGVKRFHAMKTSWGFAKLLSLETFKDFSNGYVIGDSCEFGAEIFVITHKGIGESVSLVKAPAITKATFKWEIDKFSELDKDYVESAEFTVAERKWKLRIRPKGSDDAGKYLSVYLMASDWLSQATPKSGVHTKYKLRVVDQLNGKHTELQCSKCFCPSVANVYKGCGCHEMVSLDTLHEHSNGFILKDSLTVEVEFLEITLSKYSGGINQKEESERSKKSENRILGS